MGIHLVLSCYVLSCPSDFAPVSLAWHRQQRGIQKYLRTCFIIKRPDSFFFFPSYLSKQHCFIACFIAMRCCCLFIPFYSVQPAWRQFRSTLSVTPFPPPFPPPPQFPAVPSVVAVYSTFCFYLISAVWLKRV